MQFGAFFLAGSPGREESSVVFKRLRQFVQDSEELGFDSVWFAEHHSSNKMGMFDTNTGQFREWTSPTPHTNPYDTILDKNEDLWMGGMASDRITRVNTRTNEIIEYLLPRTTNVRRVYVDNGPATPAFWVGNNTEAMIIKLEPLE